MKYKTEKAIKEAIGLKENQTWRNLSKKHVLKFAALMPEMDKDVMLKIINTSPEFMKFGNELLTGLRKTVETTADKNSKDYTTALNIIKETQQIYKEQLNKEETSDEIKKVILNNLLEVTKMIPKMDENNKNFYEIITGTALAATGLVVGVTFAILGGKFGFEKFNPKDK